MLALDEVLPLLRSIHRLKTGNGDASHIVGETRDGWQEVIEVELTDWRQHPERLEDEDGYVAPSADILQQATKLVRVLRDRDVAPPSSIVPDGEGGIVFAWRQLPHHIIAQIHADTDMEIVVFNAATLISRQRVKVEKSA